MILAQVRRGREGTLQLTPVRPLHRGTDGRHDKELAQAVRSLLERAAATPAQAPAAKRLGRRSSHTDTWDLHWSALSATRAALRGLSSCSRNPRQMEHRVSGDKYIGFACVVSEYIVLSCCLCKARLPEFPDIREASVKLAKH